MNRLFLRFGLLVLLSVSAATVVIYFAIRYVFGDPLEEIARRQAVAPIFLLEQYIDQAPADEWLVRLNKVREVSNFDLELIPLDAARNALHGGRVTALEHGDIVLDIAGKSFYRRVDLRGERYVGSDDEVIHVQGLPIDVGLAVKMEALRFVIIALALLIPIAFWSRAHWRGLQKLSHAADAFGAGKLDARVEMSKNDSIYPLADCMNQMAQRIEGLLDAHRNLLHSVSHELRTPIARLEFGLELLREEAQMALPLARMQAMEEDLAELNALVKELLDLTALERQAIQASEFALADLLQNCVQLLDHQLADKQVQLDVVGSLGNIVADQRLLTRALRNLLLNAVKYSDKRIAVSAQRDSGGDMHITIEDDGPGIPIEERERIFQPFYRLDRSRDRETGGFGLGLAIAQKAVALHGGHIAVAESALGGAKFRLVLRSLSG
jgi:signal transduction histidine kinase